MQIVQTLIQALILAKAYFIVTLRSVFYTMEEEKFFYFAYGSNLLTERIRINNPSATFKSIGFLREYKLDFNNVSKVHRKFLSV